MSTSDWDAFRAQTLANIERIEKQAREAGEDAEETEDPVDEMEAEDGDDTEAGTKTNTPQTASNDDDDSSDDEEKDADDDSKDSDDDEEKDAKNAGDDEDGEDSDDEDADDEKDAKKAKNEINLENVNSLHFAKTNSWVFLHNDQPLARITCESAFGDTSIKAAAYFAGEQFIHGVKKNMREYGVMATLRNMNAEIFNLDNAFEASPQVDPAETRAEALSQFANVAGMVIEGMQKNLIPNPLKAGMFQVFAQSGVVQDEQQLIALVEDVTSVASADYTEKLIEQTLRYMNMTEGERSAAYGLIAGASVQNLDSLPGRNARAQELARNSMNIATPHEGGVTMDRTKLKDLLTK